MLIGKPESSYIKLCYISKDTPEEFIESYQTFKCWWDLINQWTDCDFKLLDNVVYAVQLSKDDVAMAMYDFNELQDKVDELWEEEKTPLDEQEEWGTYRNNLQGME